MRSLLLGMTIGCGFLLVTKALQVSLTPEFWAWLAAAGPAVMGSAGVKVLGIAFGLFVLALLIVPNRGQTAA